MNEVGTRVELDPAEPEGRGVCVDPAVELESLVSGVAENPEVRGHPVSVVIRPRLWWKMQARSLAPNVGVVIGLTLAAKNLNRTPDVVADALQPEGQIAVSLAVAGREFPAPAGKLRRAEVGGEPLLSNGCRVGH